MIMNVFVVVGLLLVSCTRTVDAVASNTNFKTCAQQDACIDPISITQVAPQEQCSGGECEYEICLTLNWNLPGCTKMGPVKQTCGYDDVCDTALTTTWTKITTASNYALNSGGTRCQRVSPGGVATFAFFDGKCSSGGGLTREPGVECNPTDNATPYYCQTGNVNRRKGKECVWTITAPTECGGGGGAPEPTPGPTPGPTPVPSPLPTSKTAPGQGGGGSLDSCEKQSDCISYTIDEESPDACTGGDCQMRVCLTLNTAKAGCVKDGKISHLCLPGGGDDPQTCNPNYWDLNIEGGNEQGYGYLRESGTQCKIVPAGSVATFVLKDGQGCDGSYNDGVASCTAHVDETSCSGNQGKECFWRIQTPECGGLPEPPICDLDLFELEKYLLIGTVSNDKAKAVAVGNGDLGSDAEVLSTEIDDNTDVNLVDVFLNSDWGQWVNGDPDFLCGAGMVAEETNFGGDVALTSPNGVFDASNLELYGSTGVTSAKNNAHSSVSNSLFFEAPSMSGLGLVANGYQQDVGLMAMLRGNLCELEDYMTGLRTESCIGAKDVSGCDVSFPSDLGIEDIDIWELNVDELDKDGDGIAVIDIDMGDNGDFKITNSNWIIESEAGTFAIFRLLKCSKLVLNQGTILIGDGIFDNTDYSCNKPTGTGRGVTSLGAVIMKASKYTDANGNFYGEYTEESGTTFDFNDVVINGVGIYDLIAWECQGVNQNTNFFDDGGTELTVNNGQGCSQFISPKIGFSNVRFDLCNGGCGHGDAPTGAPNALPTKSPTSAPTGEPTFYTPQNPKINIEKTVVLGTPDYCNPGEELVESNNGAPVTYIYVVTNTGDSCLDSVVVTDGPVGYAMTLVTYGNVMYPGTQYVLCYPSEIDGPLTSSGYVIGNPVYCENKDDIDGLDDVTDSDPAGVNEIGVPNECTTSRTRTAMPDGTFLVEQTETCEQCVCPTL